VPHNLFVSSYSTCREQKTNLHRVWQESDRPSAGWMLTACSLLCLPSVEVKSSTWGEALPNPSLADSETKRTAKSGRPASDRNRTVALTDRNGWVQTVTYRTTHSKKCRRPCEGREGAVRFCLTGTQRWGGGCLLSSTLSVHVKFHCCRLTHYVPNLLYVTHNWVCIWILHLQGRNFFTRFQRAEFVV